MCKLCRYLKQRIICIKRIALFNGIAAMYDIINVKTILCKQYMIILFCSKIHQPFTLEVLSPKQEIKIPGIHLNKARDVTCTWMDDLEITNPLIHILKQLIFQHIIVSHFRLNWPTVIATTKPKTVILCLILNSELTCKTYVC